MTAKTSRTLGAAAAAVLLAALGTAPAAAHTEESKAAKAAPAAKAPPPDLSGRTSAEIEQKQRGYFTDSELVDQDGRKVRFYTDVLRGKLVVINFIYTDCGDACPLITHKLVQTRQQLGETFGRDVRFVSVSIDPQRDTPAELKKFARKFDADHPEWVFLTGDKPKVDLVLKKLGAYTDNVESHFTGIIAGNLRADRWRKIRPDTPPNIIADTVRYLAADPVASGAGPRVAPTR